MATRFSNYCGIVGLFRGWSGDTRNSSRAIDQHPGNARRAHADTFLLPRRSRRKGYRLVCMVFFPPSLLPEAADGARTAEDQRLMPRSGLSVISQAISTGPNAALIRCPWIHFTGVRFKIQRELSESFFLSFESPLWKCQIKRYNNREVASRRVMHFKST